MVLFRRMIFGRCGSDVEGSGPGPWPTCRARWAEFLGQIGRATFITSIRGSGRACVLEGPSDLRGTWPDPGGFGRVPPRSGLFPSRPGGRHRCAGPVYLPLQRTIKGGGLDGGRHRRAGQIGLRNILLTGRRPTGPGPENDHPVGVPSPKAASSSVWRTSIYRAELPGRCVDHSGLLGTAPSSNSALTGGCETWPSGSQPRRISTTGNNLKFLPPSGSRAGNGAASKDRERRVGNPTRTTRSGSSP